VGEASLGARSPSPRPGALPFTRDFSDQGGLWRTFGVLVTIVAAVGIIAIGAQHWLQRRSEGIAGYKEWMATGPSCPTPSKPVFDASDGRRPQVTTFGEARFAREHGSALCADVVDDRGRGGRLFAVCQFDHPGLVEVSTHKGLYWFWAGYMSPATISIRHDTPACVIGATRDFGHRLVYDSSPRAAPAATFARR